LRFFDATDAKVARKYTQAWKSTQQEQQTQLTQGRQRPSARMHEAVFILVMRLLRSFRCVRCV